MPRASDSQRRGRRGEALLIALFAAILCFQLFVPPSLGMADNGDYARLIGRFSLGPWHPDTPGAYAYLTTAWIYDRPYFWVSDNFSSELLPISGAVLIGWLFNSYHFDVRVLGALHALLWTGCFGAFLLMLRRIEGAGRWAIAIAALFFFTDANYVAFFNSFYMDAAAFLFLAWSVVLWLTLVTAPKSPSLWLFLAFACASALCTMSKSQHVPVCLPLFALGLLAAFSFPRRNRKLGAVALALLIPLGAWAEYASMPPTDSQMPQYAIVFRKILERSHTQASDLVELGLGPEYAPYVGHDRPSLSDANADQAWWNEYLRRTGRGRVLLFHLRHPWRTASMLYWDLKFRAPDRRMQILGKYERDSGYPPQAQAVSFGWWTALRSALFRLAPWHILVWFAAVIAVSARLAVRERGTVARVAILSLALSVMALMEFAVSSLSDAGETERHLFLFHVLTDFTILCAVAWVCRYFDQRRSAILPSGPTAQSEPSRAALSAL